ncbi:exo-alpha-sialidase [Frateuria terrea]|uniref:BNR repeat-like domain-containing protein n=1 Tax=Frateuria terrea TaxID=529704 RepID=A0A1H6S0M5_9GAMM|nr:exo-alpha-sialidase [Frateuria terrea]SEI61501.1 BNR repeat-like domain-containing protein [Frateuria terrea]SFP22872.1 BNR repeat-like domain-containing protein [Frateuria terrea]
MTRPILLPCALACALALAWVPAAAAPGPAQATGKVLADGVGYVSAVRLAHQPEASSNGRMLMVFERDGMGGIPLYESVDGGAHWRFLSNVTDQAHGGDPHWQLRWQPHLSELAKPSADLPTGTLLLAANATGNDATSRLVAEDLQLYTSTDGGRRWRYRGSIVKGGGNPSDKDNHGVWEPNVHRLDDGRLVAYYSSEKHKAEGFNQLLAHKVSGDGGRHWGKEKVDVAIPGGVERPGMAVVDRLPDGRYVMTYEDIDGPNNGQVYLKTSADGLDWGDPADRGTPVRTAAGAWPAASPIVRWLPWRDGPGVIAVVAERAGGDGDPSGRSIYWNNDGGRGPWWEAAAPVQKLTGNIHAGWTQALLAMPGARLWHATTSSDAADPQDARKNVVMYADAPARFDRYEAEDAARRWSVRIGDPGASNGAKARMASAPGGQLSFPVHVSAGGAYRATVRWQDLGFTPALPVLRVNGATWVLADRTGQDGWHLATASGTLRAGDNTVVIEGAQRPADVDYLQLDPATRGGD